MYDTQVFPKLIMIAISWDQKNIEQPNTQRWHLNISLQKSVKPIFQLLRPGLVLIREVIQIINPKKSRY